MIDADCPTTDRPRCQVDPVIASCFPHERAILLDADCPTTDRPRCQVDPAIASCLPHEGAIFA